MSQTSHEGPRGIGGWLLFYVIGSVGLAPIYLAFLIVSAISGKDRSLATWSTMLDLSLDIASGCLLIFKKEPFTIRAVVASLLFSLAAGTGWFIHDCMSKWTSDTLVSYLATVLQIALWIGYFRKSRRVLNTYGGSL